MQTSTSKTDYIIDQNPNYKPHFVPINNPDMDVFEIETWINTTRKATKDKKISPTFAKEILTKTNHYAHIKKVLKSIRENCKTKEEIASYKEFLLSCVYEREMSPLALEDLRYLANMCDCSNELESYNKVDKFYKKNDCQNVVTIKTHNELISTYWRIKETTGWNDIRLFVYANNFDGAEVQYPRVKEFVFKNNSSINLEDATELSGNLDFSMCQKAVLTNCNLKDVNKLNFGENTSVYLGYANYIPNKLDVSMCPFVRLDRYDFYFQPLKFKKDAEIYLEDSYNLPNVFDLSMCAKISLDNAYLIGVKEIKFGNNAEVSLKNCTCVPKNMDFSMCSKVDLKHSNLYSAKIIKFKNKKQMEEANLDTSNFAGRIIFAEENTRLPNPNTPEI